MKKRGFRYVIVGLGLGIAVGLGVRAAEKYVGQQLVQILEDEVKGSCNCRFEYDDLKVSLITLRAVAKGARIVAFDERGQSRTAMLVPTLRGAFSLANIRSREVLLTELRLEDASVDAVGPDSPSYLFIDHLTEPLPPERRTPDRWTLKLMRLTLARGKFQEPFGRLWLRGEDVSLDMKRNVEDDFVMMTAAPKLRVDLPSGRSVPLGSLNGELFLEDSFIDFRKLSLRYATSLLEASALSWSPERHALEGGVDFTLRSDSFDEALGDRVASGVIRGEGIAQGRLARPELLGQLRNMTPLRVGPPENPILDFQSGRGQWLTRLTDSGAFYGSVHDLTLQGPQCSLVSTTPIEVTKDSIRGTLNLVLNEYQSDDISLRGVTLAIELGGEPTAIEPTVSGRIAELFTQGTVLKDVAVDATLRGHNLDLTLRALGDSNAHLSFDLTRGLQLTRGTFNAHDLPLPHDAPAALVTASGDITPSTANRFGVALTGSGEVRLLQPALTLPATFSLQEQAIISLGSPKTTPLSAEITFHPRTNSGTITARSENVDLALSEKMCARLHSELSYDFALAAPLLGNGTLRLHHAALGCDKEVVSLPPETNLTINRGALEVHKLHAITETGSVVLHGDISAERGLHLTADGEIDLPTIAGLFPALDDLRGQATVQLSLTGPVAAPVIRGRGAIEGGEVVVESGNINARNITGTIVFQDDRAVLTMSGLLNDGAATISGTIFPFDIARSELDARVERMQFEPLTETYLVISAALTLRRDARGRPTISGTVTVPEAELQRNISVGLIVRTIAESIFRRALPSRGKDPLPDIDLDVAFTAPRGAYVVTNFAGVELRANLAIRGTLQNPLISGTVETLGGWFGLKNRQFEISNGTLRFNPDHAEPELNLTGETALTGRGGELISVSVRVAGQLSNPRVTFSSSSGLSERELVVLLTQGGSNLLQSQRSASGRESDASTLSVVSGFSALGFNRLLSSLTKIDTISVEPTYNPLTGHVEPSVVATKHLSDVLRLIGETFIGSGGGRVRALYDINPRLIGAVSIASEQDKTVNPVGVDLSYTVLARKRPTTTLQFTGITAVPESDLRGALKISEFIPVALSDLPDLKERLERFYSQRGFLRAQVTVSCVEQAENAEHIPTCRTIDFSVVEGPHSSVREIILTGDPIAAIIAPRTLEGLTSVTGTVFATRDFARKRRDLLTRALRNEGYIGSRVEEKYQPIATSTDQTLQLGVYLGDPVTFTFRGNSVFSDRELLDTINLFERRQPFGLNTISILLQNIERSYRAIGYLYATIALETQEEQLKNGGTRRNYSIAIDEGPRVPVRRVSIIGAPLSETLLQQTVTTEAPEQAAAVFQPQFAIAEEIERNQELLTAALIELGFPIATVTGRIENLPQTERSEVAIEYTVVPGPRVVASTCSVVGLPSDVPVPAIETGVYSVPKINRLLDTIRADLRRNGYFRAEVRAAMAEDSGPATISVVPNQGAKIGAISIVGLSHVPEALVLSTLGFKTGDRWQEPVITTASEQLLRLGLFDRVAIDAADGSWDGDTEPVRVAVTEATRQLLDIGLGLNSEYGIHIFGEGVDRSLFNDGRSIGLRVDTYYDSGAADISRGTANLRYADPNFLWNNLSLTEDLRFQRLEQSTEPFDLDRWSLGSYLHHLVGEQESISFGHTLLHDQLDNVEPGAVIGEFDTGSVKLGYLSSTYSLDRRDNPLTPHQGYTFTLDSQLAAPVFGSEAHFGSLGVRGSYIVPLPDLRWVLATHQEIREAWAFGPTDEVPLSERYFLGGRTTVRGFRENSLGARGIDGAVIGGDRSYAGAVELQYFFVDAASVHFFFDAGTVNIRSRSGLFDDLRTSTGIGVRYLSPIGPIGFDLGHPLNEKEGEPSLRLHFTIGTSF